MFCKTCGAQLADDAAFCSKCGNAVAKVNTYSPTNSVWKAAGDLGVYAPAADDRSRQSASTETTYNSGPSSNFVSPPNSTVQQAPVIIQTAPAKTASKKWLIPVIIISTLVLAATILLATAKKCDHCGKLFWGQGHNLFGYEICDECWN